MSWHKYFKTTDTSGRMSPIGSKTRSSSLNQFSYNNYQNTLPEVYSGHPSRTDRYMQYDSMDGDSEVNACLDIISEFSTQENEQNHTAFNIAFHEKPTENEVKIITKQLQQWVKLNDLQKRIFKIFRNTIKYGDQVFIRDPETFELFWVETQKVSRVIVNESKGKEPEQYIIKDINPNFENLTVAAKTTTNFQVAPPSGGYSAPFNYTVPNQPNGNVGRFSNNPSEEAIDAKHIVHLSLTEGLDVFWPFGVSILENIFKVFKQKELIEDAILIYRIQRAPERRVFNIDVGNMPSHLAMGFVERVKNEIHQRRIPTQSADGTNMLDSSYSPLGINEDYFFPKDANGRGSTVDTLPGGCLSMDTKVKLLDGRDLSIREISEELKEHELWTYSCEPVTGKIVPGLISWAGITQKHAKVLKITLGSGDYILATPDHKFPLFEIGFVEAKDLKEGESIIPFYNESNKIEQNKKYSINKIETLSEKIEVGTLTIDDNEIYHNYHTFALSCGVFTKNSNLNEIDDLKYFNNKMARGLRVPSSYLPTGPDENDQGYHDGQMGTALIQEFRFNQYCERLQKQVIANLNKEFKMFLAWRGFNIDAGIYDLQFNHPQNFASYRQSELDQTRLSNYSNIADIPYMSKRFGMKRYLGLTEEEMAENNELWREENGVGDKSEIHGDDLRSVGVTPGGINDDIDMGENFGSEEGEFGSEEGPDLVPEENSAESAPEENEQ